MKAIQFLFLILVSAMIGTSSLFAEQLKAGVPFQRSGTLISITTSGSWTIITCQGTTGVCYYWDGYTLYCAPADPGSYDPNAPTKTDYLPVDSNAASEGRSAQKKETK
jgi:hypothetical protein